jgi:enoyl-[acyl-carrier protein] reductase I
LFPGPARRRNPECLMIEHGKTYLVMGLLDPHSIAWAIGRRLAELGAAVIYTFQNETLKKRYWDSNKELTEGDRTGLAHRFCDVADPKQIEALFAGLPPLAGVAHSIAYANPKTCLGPEFHTEALEDILRSYQVSCISLAPVVRHAARCMPGGGSVVALTFESRRAFALYNWMGVHKAALEALVRALARRHGREGIRVNAVSAGPLATTAAGRIPEFDRLTQFWQQTSPLPWDTVRDKAAVADAVAFLLGPQSRKITGQVLHVDGGASVIGGSLLDFERPGE